MVTQAVLKNNKQQSPDLRMHHCSTNIISQPKQCVQSNNKASVKNSIGKNEQRGKVENKLIKKQHIMIFQ